MRTERLKIAFNVQNAGKICTPHSYVNESTKSKIIGKISVIGVYLILAGRL